MKVKATPKFQAKVGFVMRPQEVAERYTCGNYVCDKVFNPDLSISLCISPYLFVVGWCTYVNL